MNVTINDTTETRKDVIVTLSAEEVSAEQKKIIREYVKQAKVPGFRPGKAPESRVRQLFGSRIQGALKEALMRKAYDEVIQRKDLDVHSIVEFPEPADISEGQEVSLDLTVDVTPQFELPEYKGIVTHPPATEVTDGEVEEAIERIRRQRADFEVVERPAAATDYVKLSYTGSVNGEAIAEQLKDQSRLQAWGAVSEGWEEAGTDEAKQFGVPAIIDGVVGMAAGDKKTVEQVIADDFAVEALRGQTVSYEIEVLEVRERKLPEMDEAFLKSVRAETIEDFKAQILDDLEGRKKRDAQDAQRSQILDFLAGAVDFAVPESALETETQNAMGRIISQNMQMGVGEEEFEKHKEQIYAGAAQTAARDVKLQILLNRIARKEEVKVENEDLSRAIYSIAIQQRMKPEDLAKELRKDRNKVVQLQRQILFSKTLDLLVKESKVEAAPIAAENAES